MFECIYKYELQDSIISAKYVYRAQKRKQDKAFMIMVPILLAMMIGLLIFDIVNGKSIIWDIVLICALLVLEAMYLIVPVMLVQSQKKSYAKQNLADMDYLKIIIDNGVCTEILLKDEKEVTRTIHNLNALTSYLEDETRLILVFNTVEFVGIRKNKLNKNVKELKAYLEKAMLKQKNKKRVK